jgi:hypothetical protein
VIPALQRVGCRETAREPDLLSGWSGSSSWCSIPQVRGFLRRDFWRRRAC